jgi:YVTN family beta-propeller protein
VDETGRRAYVALQTAGALAVLDLGTGQLLQEVAVGDGPSEVVRIKDTLFVVREEAGEVVVLDGTPLTVRKRLPLSDAPPEVRAWLQDHRFSPAETEKLIGSGTSNLHRRLKVKKASLFVHQHPKNHIPATQVAQGWVFTNALTLANEPLPATLILDEPQRGFADPSDLAVSPHGEQLFIACAGADVVLVVGVKQMTDYLFEGRKHYAGPDDLTASRRYVIAQLATQANPRRLALSGDGKTLVVSNHLADSLTVIDAEKLKVLRHIPLGGAKPDAARRGEILFNSSKLTALGQFTCASCHPNGGSDGLTWDLERDGVGTFKKTKALLGVKDTAPYGWHGSSPTLADRVSGTLRTLHRNAPTEAEVKDLVAYLESLPPLPPRPVKEADQPAVARGKELFQGKGQCAVCHQRAGFDDGKSHDVGTGDRFDTPSLRGVSRSMPYLHDGRAKTLEEVFSTYNPRQRHGAAHLLGKEELADLIAYLKSL